MDTKIELYGTQKVNKTFDRLARISTMKSVSPYDIVVINAVLEVSETYNNTEKYSNVDEAMADLIIKIKNVEPELKLKK